MARIALYRFGLLILMAALPVPGLAVTEGPRLQPALTFSRVTSSSQDKGEDSPNEASVVDIDLNLGVGYTMGGGLHLGGKLLWQSSTFDSSSNSSLLGDSSSKSETTMTGYGPTIGYEAGNGFVVTGSYILSADSSSTSERDTNSGSTTIETTEEDSGGILLDVGYAFDFQGIKLGPQLVYFQRTYEKTTTESTDTSGSTTKSESEGTYEVTTLEPYLGFWLEF